MPLPPPPVSRYEVARATRADKRRARRQWERVRQSGSLFRRRLTAVAKQIGQLVEGFAPDGRIADSTPLVTALNRYGEALKPWARNVSAQMIAEVDQRDQVAWVRASRALGRVMKRELNEAPTGLAQRRMLAEQVTLITSLPLDAAQRVHELTLQGLTQSTRASEIAKAILATGHVSESRARLIARTEVARTASTITQARAEYVGSTHYIWRTVGDSDVREIHRELNGRVIAWNDPPVAGEAGERAHAGAIYNCFTGDTLCLPRQPVLRAFRAQYRGVVVSLEIGNSLLRVTPNHPILTAGGLRAAHSLQVGDEVVCMPQQSADAVEQDIYRAPTPIEQVFQALAATTNMESVAVHDFYGDIVESQVDVVRTARRLPIQWQPAGLESLGYLRIPGSLRAVVRAVDRRLTQVFESYFAGALDQSFAIVDGGLLHSQVHRFAAGAELDATCAQALIDCERRHAVALRELWGCLPRAVQSGHFGFWNRRAIGSGSAMRDHESPGTQMTAQDVRVNAESPRHVFEQRAPSYQRTRVRSKRVVDFSGHVYTLETRDGYYGTGLDAIASKNCRCYPEPILPDVD